MEQGTHVLGNYKVVVGVTPDNAVGSNLTVGYRIAFEELQQGSSFPAFFSEMLTSNDEIASTIRIKSRDSNSVTLIKDREKSSTYSDPAAETVGWLAVFDQSVIDGLTDIKDKDVSVVEYYSLNGCRMKDRPSGKGIYIVRLSDGNIRKIFL